MNGGRSWLIALHDLQKRSHGTPVGEFSPPAKESVRLRGAHSLIVDQSWRLHEENDGKPVLSNPWFSLMGAVGALPLVFTDKPGRGREKRPSARQNFLDIFNHRAQSLLYRSQCTHRVTLDAGLRGCHTAVLSAICGVASEVDSQASRSAASFPGEEVIAHAALFARRVRSAVGLTQLLRGKFALDICVLEFTASHHDIAPEMQTQLGRHRGQNNRLGENSLLGSRATLVDSHITIVVSVHTLQEFERTRQVDFSLQLQTVIRAFVSGTVDFTIDMELPTRYLAQARITTAASGQIPARLGLGVIGTAKQRDKTRLRMVHQGQEPRLLRPS